MALPLRSRELFYQTLHRNLEAGVPLRTALDRAGLDPKTARIVATVKDHIGSGRTLAQALELEAAVPRDELALIRAGEKSGNLPLVFETLSDHLLSRQRLRARLGFAVLLPLLLFLFAAAVLHAEVLYFEGFSVFIKAWFKTIFITFAVIGVLLTGIGLLLSASSTFSRIAFHMPYFFIPSPIATINRLKFYFLLKHLYSAGMSFTEFGKAAIESSVGPYAKMEIEKIHRLLQKNEPLASAVGPSSFLPLEEKHLIATGEDTGSLDRTADRLLSLYQEKMQSIVNRIPWIVGIFAYGLVSIFIIKKIFSTFAELGQIYDTFLNL